MIAAPSHPKEIPFVRRKSLDESAPVKNILDAAGTPVDPIMVELYLRITITQNPHTYGSKKIGKKIGKKNSQKND